MRLFSFLHIVPPAERRLLRRNEGARRAGCAHWSRGSSILQLVMGTISQLLIKIHGVPRSSEGSCRRSKFPFAFLFFVFSSEVPDTLFPLLDLYLSYCTTILRSPLPHLHLLLFLRPSCCMEQRRMHPQQPTRNAHDAAPYDISHSPFYTSFPGLELQGDPKVTEAPHLSPSYVQQQYAHHDNGSSLEPGGSPPLSFRIHEQPQQGHPRLVPPPAPQYHQPSPTASYSVFTYDHEGHNPTPQGLSHPFPRAPPHPAHLSINPWAPGPFSEDATAAPLRVATAAPRRVPPIYGPTYALRPQPMYPLSTIHPPAPTHVPPEQSQPTTTLAPATLPEQHEDRASIDHGQRSRSWGAGSLDVTTGVFVRTPDHPRIRTAQACEKCRLRKAKVSVVLPRPLLSLLDPF
jgi:hypothetical protein